MLQSRHKGYSPTQYITCLVNSSCIQRTLFSHALFSQCVVNFPPVPLSLLLNSASFGAVTAQTRPVIGGVSPSRRSKLGKQPVFAIKRIFTRMSHCAQMPAQCEPHSSHTLKIPIERDSELIINQYQNSTILPSPPLQQ